MLTEGGIRTVDPEADGEGVDRHGRPFEKDRSEGEALAATCADDVVDAEWQMCEEEGAEEDGNPDVPDCV